MEIGTGMMKGKIENLNGFVKARNDRRPKAAPEAPIAGREVVKEKRRAARIPVVKYTPRRTGVPNSSSMGRPNAKTASMLRSRWSREAWKNMCVIAMW